MGLFEGSHHYHENEQAAMAYENDTVPHQAKLSHELLGGAAAFYAMRKYEQHLAATGQQPSHALFKEFLAGAAGFEVDRLIETKGADAIDRHRAKKHAEEQAEQMYNAKFRPDAYQPPPQGWGYNTGGPPYQGGGGYGGGYGGPPQGGYGGGPPQGGYGGGGGYGGPPQAGMQQQNEPVHAQGGYGGGGYGGPPQGYGGPPQGGYGGPQGGYGGGGY